MKNANNVLNGLSLVLVMMALSACGSRSANNANLTSSGQNSGSTTVNSGNATGNIYGLAPAPEANFQLTGSAGTMPTAVFSDVTETKLKIKITPLPASAITAPGYGNWTFIYGCLSVNVTVNGVTKNTGYIKVPGIPQGPYSPCANSAEYKVLDFSSNLTGNGPVTITVKNAFYDNCRLYGNQNNYNCTPSAVYQTHVVNGMITINTNDTYMAE